MRKINRSDVLKLVLVLAFVAAIGASLGAIGRFTPTHAIVEPVYCGACHTDQVRELGATTHLPHFANAIMENAEAALAGNHETEITTAEAVSGGCMMCHNTWNNREKIYVAGYNLSLDGNGDYKLKYNDATWKSDGTITRYDVLVNVTAPSDYVRLGTDVTSIKVYTQDPGSADPAVVGDGGIATKYTKALVLGADYSANTTGITFLAGGTISGALAAGSGSVFMTYKTTNGTTVSYKKMWGDLSANSPSTGYFFNDITGSPSCGNLEKGACHAVEVSIGRAAANTMLENLGGTGSGNGVYFQHEMAYTSAEYAAKQVKLCGACHVNKLPPMTADGEPIRLDSTDVPQLTRTSHGAVTFETNISTVSNDWAHRQVQCVRCHGHAGIGTIEEGITGVRANTNMTGPFP